MYLVQLVRDIPYILKWPLVRFTFFLSELGLTGGLASANAKTMIGVSCFLIVAADN
jgi:hypothetical protein